MKLVHQDQLSSARATAVSHEVAIHFYWWRHNTMQIFGFWYPKRLLWRTSIWDQNQQKCCFLDKAWLSNRRRKFSMHAKMVIWVSKHSPRSVEHSALWITVVRPRKHFIFEKVLTTGSLIVEIFIWGPGGTRSPRGGCSLLFERFRDFFGDQGAATLRHFCFTRQYGARGACARAGARAQCKKRFFCDFWVLKMMKVFCPYRSKTVNF